MTIDRHSLRVLSEAWAVRLSKEQEKTILGRFRRESYPYTWSEEAIVSQIEHFLLCGKFVETDDLMIDPENC
jgi:hypothetical protein